LIYLDLIIQQAAIAIPIGFLAMRRWLRGFVYHVPLSAWTFVLPWPSPG